MKFVIWATAGAGDPTKASIPFHLAVNGSAEAGYDTELILAGDAAEIIIGDSAEKIEGVGIPPMRELLAKARDHKIPVYI
jgi:predicted peroxiredoxin